MANIKERLRAKKKWVQIPGSIFSERIPDPDCSEAAARITALEAECERLRALPGPFDMGDRVEKIKGSCWRGKVVGFYSTKYTPVGYAVESENEPGSVQIYPAAALRALTKEES